MTDHCFFLALFSFRLKVTMATGGSNMSVMSDSSFEEHRGRYCAICYHRYARDGSSVPRILSCGHSFCTGKSLCK